MRLMMKPWCDLEKQSTPTVRTWQVTLPIVSSHPSGITFASDENPLLPPHTNLAAPWLTMEIVSPQVFRQAMGCGGAAHTRR